MPRVRFTAAPKLPTDWADKPYREGWEGEMSEDEAARWVRRRVAVIVPPPQPAKAAERHQSAAPEPAKEAAHQPAAPPERPQHAEKPEDRRVMRHHQV